MGCKAPHHPPPTPLAIKAIAPEDINPYFVAHGELDSQGVASSGRVPKGPGSIPGGAKVLGTNGICKYLPVSVSSYVEVCLCLLCSVCIN